MKGKLSLVNLKLFIIPVLEDKSFIKVDRPDNGVYVCSVEEEMMNIDAEDSSPTITHHQSIYSGRTQINVL